MHRDVLRRKFSKQRNIHFNSFSWDIQNFSASVSLLVCSTTLGMDEISSLTMLWALRKVTDLLAPNVYAHFNHGLQRRSISGIHLLKYVGNLCLIFSWFITKRPTISAPISFPINLIIILSQSCHILCVTQQASLWCPVQHLSLHERFNQQQGSKTPLVTMQLTLPHILHIACLSPSRELA